MHNPPAPLQIREFVGWGNKGKGHGPDHAKGKGKGKDKGYFGKDKGYFGKFYGKGHYGGFGY